MATQLSSSPLSGEPQGEPAAAQPHEEHLLVKHQINQIDQNQHQINQLDQNQHDVPQHQINQLDQNQQDQNQHDVPQHDSQHDLNQLDQNQLDPQHDLNQHDPPQQDLNHHDTQHDNSQHDNSQHNNSQHDHEDAKDASSHNGKHYDEKHDLNSDQSLPPNSQRETEIQQHEQQQQQQQHQQQQSDFSQIKTVVEIQVMETQGEPTQDKQPFNTHEPTQHHEIDRDLTTPASIQPLSSPPVNSVTNGTDTPSLNLHVPASKGDKDTLLQILSNPAVDINTQDGDGFTALTLAARNGHARCVKLLLKHGAKVNIKDHANNLPIHLAVLGDHRKSAQQLVEIGGARVNRRNGEGYTPIHLAVLFGYEKMVKLLLDKGARVDKTTVGKTPQHTLHLAAIKGNIAIMRQLLATKPAQLNPLDVEGRTPLFLAVENDSPEIVAALVMHGAAVSMPSRTGELPLSLAIKRGYEDICHTLCTNGADVSLRYSLPYNPHRTSRALTDSTVTATEATTVVPSAMESTQDDNTSAGSALSDSDEVPLDLVIQVDRYGHVNKSNHPDNPNPRASKLLKIEMRRAKKWSHMIKQWNVFSTKKSEKLHVRVHKGIPDCVRGEVWKLLAGEAEDARWVQEQVSAGVERYQRLQGEESKWTTQIDLDVNRAARNHLMFRERYGKGQRALFNILKAYSSHDTEVGYCQGMSDMAALLLKYVTEDEGFWMLERIMNAPKWRMRDLFLPGFPRLQQAFYIHDSLLALYCPVLSSHLIKENVLAPFYATKWYLMAFLDIFPFEVTLRLWDLLFSEGYTIVYSIGVGVMRMYEAEFLGKSFDKIMAFFRGLETMPLNVDKFIANIVKHRIPMRKILLLEEEYNKKSVH